MFLFYLQSYDKIGVLYTILVEEDELEKGFLSFRNRDTNIIVSVLTISINQIYSFKPT